MYSVPLVYELAMALTYSLTLPTRTVTRFLR